MSGKMLSKGGNDWIPKYARPVSFLFHVDQRSNNNVPLILYQQVTGFVVANCLHPDQTQQNVGSDLDPNCLTL